MSHLPGHLSPPAINDAMTLLANAHPSFVQRITIGRSAERRDIHALKIGKGTRGVLLIGGMHAREVVNPDLLLSLGSKLASAYATGTGISFGPVTHSRTTVRLLIENLAIFILPMANPDGRTHVFDEAGQRMWRKTRNRNAGSSCKGVDLNRHFDLLWESGIGTTTDPCPGDFATSGVDSGDGVYKGRSPLRQPEAQAIESLLDDNPDIDCLIDVHSYSNCVLYPWGHNPNQSTDPSMNFANPAWDGMRTNDAVYREYIDPDDLYVFEKMATAIAAAIYKVRNTVYKTSQGWHFIGNYRTSATVDDWAYSRHLADPSKPKIKAWAMETGSADAGFQPSIGEAGLIIEEVSNGLLTYLSKCMCPIDLLVRRLFGSRREADRMVRDLQNYRDLHLRTTALGQKWTTALETHGFDILAAAEEDEKTREMLQAVVASAADVAATWDAKRPKKFSVELITDVRRLATRIKRAHPELGPVIDELRPDLKSIPGRTPKGVVRIPKRR